MAYCVMNVDKQGRAAVYGLQIEANREKDDKHEFDLSDIDRERTDQNYYLKKTKSWNREITKQIKEAGLKERKDSVVMITGVYTASPEFFEKCSREEMEKYFQDCLAFHIKEFCQGNEQRLLNAVIHLDETTPHMQVASVPILEDEKGLHLSAKIIMGNRSTYRLRQDRFFEEVGKKYDLERGERRDPTQTKEHTTKREWQIAKQEAQLEAYKVIEASIKEGHKPTIEVAKEEVKDGLIRSHEEYFVKVPCKDQKEAQKVQKEVTTLYNKDFANEALNELILAKNNDLKEQKRKQQRELAKAKKEFEKYKESTLKEMNQEREELTKQSEVYNNLSLEEMGIDERELKTLVKNSLAERLIDDTVQSTIDILDNAKYLKKKPNILDEKNIANGIQQSFSQRISTLVDEIRESIVQKAINKTKHKDLDLSDNLVR